MTREEALKSMTIWPAIAAFQETSSARSRRASTPTSWCSTRTSCAPRADEILERAVLSTWVGGKQVYEAK